MQKEIGTFEKASQINDHYENTGSEKRLWNLGNGAWVICYNALSDQDDIEEISEGYIDRLFEEIESE